MIDIDIYDDQRQLVYDYIINRFGKEKTAYILSMGTIAEKGCIDDIGGGLAVKWRLDHGLKKGDKSRDNENPYSLANVDRIKKEYEIDPESAKRNHPDLFYYFDGLLGTVVSQSQHPAGIIASPINLIDNYSMFLGSDGQYILPINMEEVHEVGLVKYDILGLKNIGIIRKTCEYSHIKYPLAHEINWNDQKVFADMVTSPVGIFQFEGSYAFRLLKDYGVHSVDDITLINAALRPSGESYRDRLVAHEMNHNPSKMIDDLLANSNGFLCLHKDQLVCTTRGLVPIKDIKIGDMVYNMSNEPKSVTNVYYNGKRKTYKIHTSRGDIICTDNHKIFTQLGWTEAKDIINNGVEKYCIASKVGCSGSNKIDKNVLKLIGYFLGDGILHQNGIRKSHIGFVNTNKKTIDDFCNCVDNLYSDCMKVNVTQSESRVNKLPIWYCSVVWHDELQYKNRGIEKPIITMLKEYGLFNELAQNKYISNKLFELDRDSILYLLGAYSDTDCHMGKNCIAYHCASEKLMLGIQELIRQLGYVSAFCNNNNGAYTLTVTNAKGLIRELIPYSITASNVSDVESIRPGADSVIPTSFVKQYFTDGQVSFKKGSKQYALFTKYTTINKIIDISKFKDNVKNNINKFNWIFRDDIKWSKIISVEEYEDNSDVYDIEVEDEHNFLVNGGMVVHNCYQEQTIAFLQQICGLSGGEADNVRRAIGRKQVDRLEAALPRILEGYCSKSDKPREKAEEEARAFLKIIEDSSNYQFG